MLATRFATKTLVVLFAVPMVSQFGVYLNVKPMQQFIADRAVQSAHPGVDVKELEMATKTLAISSQMTANARMNFNLEKNDTGQAAPDERLNQMLGSIDAMTSNAKAGNLTP